jgi:hypothetical protein
MVEDNINGEVRKVEVKLNEANNIIVYIEFMSSDWNDDYAYAKTENQTN